MPSKFDLFYFGFNFYRTNTIPKNSYLSRFISKINNKILKLRNEAEFVIILDLLLSRIELYMKRLIWAI
jgi:hypothetical protein